MSVIKSLSCLFGLQIKHYPIRNEFCPCCVKTNPHLSVYFLSKNFFLLSTVFWLTSFHHNNIKENEVRCFAICLSMFTQTQLICSNTETQLILHMVPRKSSFIFLNKHQEVWPVLTHIILFMHLNASLINPDRLYILIYNLSISVILSLCKANTIHIWGQDVNLFHFLYVAHKIDSLHDLNYKIWLMSTFNTVLTMKNQQTGQTFIIDVKS